MLPVVNCPSVSAVRMACVGHLCYRPGLGHLQACLCAADGTATCISCMIFAVCSVCSDGEADREEFVPMLRDVSRQEYLKKREEQKLQELKDELEDAK